VQQHGQGRKGGAQLARHRAERTRTRTHLRQHDEGEQTARCQYRGQVPVAGGVPEELADDHVVGAGAHLGQAVVEVVGEPSDAVGHPAHRGEAYPGGEPDRRHVDGVHDEAPLRQPHRDAAAAARDVQRPADHGERVDQSGGARQHAGWCGPARAGRGVPRVPALPVAGAHHDRPVRGGRARFTAV
jgi:hypothetical protein